MKVSFSTLAVSLILAGWASAGLAQGGSSKPAILNETATALGGAERIRAVKNITLVGYAHYAYQFGGGNIDASPDAPQKYQPAKDLNRVYDLENTRFQQTERRNFLFPFAAVFGHAYMPVNLILDGDLAYNIAPDGKMARVPRGDDGVFQLDGPHMRRAWMNNNPVVAVRTALDPATKVSAPRREGKLASVNM